MLSPNLISKHVINSAICFNCAETIPIYKFIHHIDNCLSKGYNEQIPNYFCALISKLTTGQNDYEEILYLYNQEIHKQQSLSIKETNASTDNGDNSFSFEDGDNSGNNILSKINQSNGNNKYIDYTSDINKVIKSKNYLRSITQKEIQNSKVYFF